MVLYRVKNNTQWSEQRGSYGYEIEVQHGPAQCKQLMMREQAESYGCYKYPNIKDPEVGPTVGI